MNEGEKGQVEGFPKHFKQRPFHQKVSISKVVATLVDSDKEAFRWPEGPAVAPRAAGPGPPAKTFD
jgi:hypothetical protein